jgi:hypothetical protein
VSIELHFDDEDWERIERDWSAWWAGELERPMVMLQNVQRFSLARELSEEFLLERPIDAVLDYSTPSRRSGPTSGPASSRAFSAPTSTATRTARRSGSITLRWSRGTCTSSTSPGTPGGRACAS